MALTSFATSLAVAMGACAPPSDSCPQGGVQDEASQGCVPARCGTARWGLIDGNSSTLYVAPDGSRDGAGSEAQPFDSIQGAADAAAEAGGGLIAVAAGTYVENLEFGEEHDRVEIAGRCLELVTIDGSDQEEPAVKVLVGEVGLRGLRGVTVTGGEAGVWVARSGQGGDVRVELDEVLLVRNLMIGLIVAHFDVEVRLDRSEVRDTLPMPDGRFGHGVEARFGARLTARDLLMEGNHGVGAYVAEEGTVADIQDVIIRATRPYPSETGGRGVSVQEGAALIASQVVLERNHEVGLWAGSVGTTLDLEDVTVRDTQPLPDGTAGSGIGVEQQAALVARRLLLEGNHDAGLACAGSGTIVDLEDAIVRGTQPVLDGSFGSGIEAHEGAAVTARGLLVEANHAVGLYVRDPGTSMELSGGIVRTTRSSPDGTLGRGASIQNGARFVAEGLVMEENHDIGLMVSDVGTIADLQDITIRDTMPVLDGQFGRGLSVRKGARLVARGVLLEENRDNGLLAAHPGTTVELEDATIRTTRANSSSAGGFGIAVQEGASLSGLDLRVEDNQGAGVYVVADGTADLSDAALLRNGFSGAVVMGATLAMHGGAINGSTPHHSSGGGLGVFSTSAYGTSDVELAGVTFADLPGPALYVRGPGRYVMRGCDVTGAGTPPWLPGGALAAEGVGLWVEAADLGLLMAGNRFHDLPGDGLLLDQSTATLDVEAGAGTPNTFEDIAGAPLIWQRCGALDAPEVLDGSVAEPACASSAMALGPLLEYTLWLSETGVVE